jgi:hypothetical protein
VHGALRAEQHRCRGYFGYWSNHIVDFILVGLRLGDVRGDA